MPILFWIDIIGLCLSIIITGSLTLLVMGVDPKNQVNRSFGFFTGTIAVWTGAALLLRLSLWLEPVLPTGQFMPNSYMWLKTAAILVPLMCIFSLMFTTAYLDRRTRRTDLAIAFGLLALILFLIRSLVNPGTTIPEVKLDANGLIVRRINPSGMVALGVFSLYILRSIVLFIRERHRPETIYLALSLIILLLGLLLRSAVYAPFPILSFSNTASALMLAYAIISKQIFNPLKAQTIQLNEEIEERKKAEGLLRGSEQRYRLLADNVADIIWVRDMNLQLIYVSPSITNQTNFTVEEYMVKTLEEIVTPDSLKLMGEVFAEELEIEKHELKDLKRSRTIDMEIKCKDGSAIWTETTMSFLRDQFDNPNGIIGVTRDTTNRNHLEAQLQHAQRMEAIGTLAGGVAHDLNNILSGIVSYPELILMDLPEGSPLIEPILTIQKSGEKAAVIVQDLLTLARRGVAISEVLNLNHIISEQLKSPEFEKLLSFHHNVQLKTNLEKGLFNIKGSSTHLSKSIMNIISNAAEAMPDGGKILISTENLYLDRPIKGYNHVEGGEYVTLTVSDTGIGIPEEDLKKIFEPFYTKKVMGRSGTGLGMAVVWGTVKDHKGYIDIQSTVGKGTSFTLYFSVTREEISKDESLLPVAGYMGKGESILVVDDVEEQREIATGMLRKLGYSVTSVSSGEEAVEYLKTNSADLIVLDMIMNPGINGRETYKRILKYYPNQKAIIASGFSKTDDVKTTQRLGAGEYIKKPYTLEKIGITVRDELKR